MAPATSNPVNSVKIFRWSDQTIGIPSRRTSGWIAGADTDRAAGDIYGIIVDRHFEL